MLSFLLSNLLTIYVCRSSRRAWDYSCTLCVVHWALTCAVSGACPDDWAWWVTMLALAAVDSSAAELGTHWLVDMKDIQTGR